MSSLNKANGGWFFIGMSYFIVSISLPGCQSPLVGNEITSKKECAMNSRNSKGQKLSVDKKVISKLKRQKSDKVIPGFFTQPEHSKSYSRWVDSCEQMDAQTTLVKGTYSQPVQL